MSGLAMIGAAAETAIAARIDAVDWPRVAADLDAEGWSIDRPAADAGRMPGDRRISTPTTRASAAGS